MFREKYLLLERRRRRKTLGGQIYTISQRRNAQKRCQYWPPVKFRKYSEYVEYVEFRECCTKRQHILYAGHAEHRRDAEYNGKTEHRYDA